MSDEPKLVLVGDIEAPTCVDGVCAMPTTAMRETEAALPDSGADTR